ncbi:MAG TPA: OB-fold nucleic acid binding domain-containing protein, partial [Terriglobales bacterium]|nr:OB-fold nucleic acid binding domain-containing protein [Terriglobales bacterium]
FQTAYLKAHYPEEFLAGLMTLEMSETDKTYKNIAECRERGFPILPPDVNESRQAFTVGQPGENKVRPIRFGLGAVKGVGAKAIEAIIAAREEGGPFRSLADFCERVQGQQVNKRVLESLIRCGAFDFSGAPRRAMLEGVERICAWSEQLSRDANSNQISLFGGANAKPLAPALPSVPEWEATERLNYERDTIGFFITGHPLDKYQRDLRRFADTSTADIRNRSHQDKIKLAGVIHSLKLKNSKKGDRYATFTLEDRLGVVEVIAWPEAYRKYEAVVHSSEPVFIAGAVDIRDEHYQVIADEIASLVDARERSVRQVHIRLKADAVDQDALHQLRAKLAEHRGACEAFLHLLLPNASETVIALPRELKVAATDSMVKDVESLFGSGVTSFQ